MQTFFGEVATMAILNQYHTAIHEWIQSTYKTDTNVFLDALKMSPNAQGYIMGCITELLLKQHLIGLGVEVKRIKEKWEGKKHPNHHGDFYFRLPGSEHWFVLESKGLKSNSEDWNKLYNRSALKKLLVKHSEIIHWIDRTSNRSVSEQVETWLGQNLPCLPHDDLYTYEEVVKYNSKGKTTPKALIMKSLSGKTRDQIDAVIANRLKYVMSRVRVLETHFVSGRSGSSMRTQATPRKDEFNVVAINTVLRSGGNTFLFANPENLEPSSANDMHLQQNYFVGFVFTHDGKAPTFDLSSEWSSDFHSVCQTLDSKNSILLSEGQEDKRLELGSE